MQAFGNSFKWLLFGDEDTVFFVDNVLELLQDFDPSMPYIITGAVLPVAGGCPRLLSESRCMQLYLLGRALHVMLIPAGCTVQQRQQRHLSMRLRR